MAAHIVIVGAGGLATAAGWALVSSLPRGSSCQLSIIDFDCIERSNLNRQVLFTEQQLGQKKAIALAKRLGELSLAFPQTQVSISPVVQRLTKENISELLSGSDFVIDGTDCVETKLLINDYCLTTKLPFCYGGVIGEQGQALCVDRSLTKDGGCLRCLFDSHVEGDFQTISKSCQSSGVLGGICGLIGALQADFALKWLRRAVVSGDEKIPDPELINPQFVRASVSRPVPHYSNVMVSADCPLGCGEQIRAMVDLRQKSCPDTFLFTKLALEKLPAGEILEAWYGTADSAKQVGQSISEEGYSLNRPYIVIADTLHKLMIQKPKKINKDYNEC